MTFSPHWPLLRPSRLEWGILLVSFSVLLLELLLTRIFSVTMYYHLAFMVVSLAMLGLGAGGLVVSLWPERFRRDDAGRTSAGAALVLAGSTVVSVGVAMRVPVVLTSTPENWLRIGFVYSLCVIPFLAGGLVVALLLTHHVENVHRLYFFDLVGAALACLVFVPATSGLGAPSAVLTGAAVAAIAAAVLSPPLAPRRRRAALAVACALAVGALVNARWRLYDVAVLKGRAEGPMLAVKWNSFSRVQVGGTPEEMRKPRRPLSAGLSPRFDPSFLCRELYLEYDAAALTPITGFDGDLSALRHLPFEVAAAPYHLRRYGNVLVLGAGGGKDVLTALAMGSGPVTALEVNPITIELMRGPFGAFTGRLYEDYPGVRVIQDEGRSYIQRSRSQYDLIQMVLVDTWTASAAGAYALTENGLYTVEAFEAYLDHLAADGVLSVSRWFDPLLVEPLRVVTLAAEALQRRGVRDPAPHVVALRTDETQTHAASLGTILIKRSPFSRDELSRLRTWARETGSIVSYSPEDGGPGAASSAFHQVLGPGRGEFIANYPFDLSAVHDDRPFFFDRVPLLPWLLSRSGWRASPLGAAELTLGGQTLLLSVAATAACTTVFLLLPLFGPRWPHDRSPAATAGSRRARHAVWAAYFASLGLGFIMVEIVLIQRLNLFLGYPSYSLPFVLFTILLASGLGSFLAGYWERPPLLSALAVLCGTLWLYALVLPGLLRSMLAAPTSMRITVSATLVAPLGVLAGMPFPSSLRLAARESARLVPWAWAVNGGASVFGSVLTVLVSMTYGLTVSLVAGGAAYGIALVLATFLGRRGPRQVLASG